jgi:MarR family transcriptional regulator, 2-MHQ and catechol-resistance regulon repressor
MKIENEIHQSKFKNEHHKLLINIMFTNNWVTDHNKKIFDDAHITLQQYNILRILRGSADGLSTSEIRERMLDKMSDTSRLVDRLCIKQLVNKKANKSDKRLVCVQISKKGLDLLKSIDVKEDEMVVSLLGLSEQEAKKLNNLLDKVRSTYNN